jgi:Xaa-Pro dipeptidase
MNRINSLKHLAFDKHGFDAFLVTNEMNQQYLTGVPGTTCFFIPKKGECALYVYNVNYYQAKAEAKDAEVIEIKRGENLAQKLAPQLKTAKTKKLAIDSLPHEFYLQIAKAIRGKAKLKIRSDLLWELRKVKDEKELELMRKAGEITTEAMKTAYETIKPTITEIQAAAQIEYTMRNKGAYGTAFDTIVASGIRSAYSHGGCTERKIRKGDLVVIDIGATYQSYRSDMTRTLTAGKPTQKQIKLYEIVKKAQEKAYQTIKPNVKAKAVDATARKIITDAGYGDRFVHGLGHGVGLEIHEMPGLAPNSKDRLAVGNVVTNEPGIYFPGFGGFRIEDTVHVRKGKAEKFTSGWYTLETH